MNRLSLLDRINHGEKWKSAKIAIASAYPADTVLTHQYGGMQIVK